MDILEYIVQKMDFVKLLEYYGFDTDNISGNILRSRCKIHKGDNPTSFVANVDTGLWFCHTGGCGGGDVFTLVEKMENINFKSAVEFVTKFYNIDTSKMRFDISKSRRKKELNEWIKYATRNKINPIKEYIPSVEMRNVVKLRSFKKETLEYFGVKYVPSIDVQKRNGKMYKINNRIYVPIIYKQIQVGYLLRKVREKDFPKWLNQPSKLDFGSLLYNYDNIKQTSNQEIVVVEGIFDVMAYHEIGVVAVATFGAHMTKEQERLLLSTFADVTLSYDGDNAGKEATKKAITSLNKKTTIRIVEMKNNSDPASVTREELLKSYNNRRIYYANSNFK